ncbi:uncharacterized protein BCR38DRAFT_480667 [Pseudomassariella vexata]|uniref:Uncharacterized protein n=1 Tax=Pseudomassariella vexata TaxID=1141098 RepID=A0A1Y2ED31_9PEZI|nr:uncharacterized protein BCR38DRAFT_480667 [Pseudomassariella vexata]ORY69481.1 hypothetical protein BCR38DRAFT_480667 [Pseudomassariella vexata]
MEDSRTVRINYEEGMTETPKFFSDTTIGIDKKNKSIKRIEKIKNNYGIGPEHYGFNTPFLKKKNAERFGHSDTTNLPRESEKPIEIAQVFAIPYIFPDEAQYPDLRFDSDSVSSWIEQVARIFKRARLSDIEKIAEVPYWTKNETYQKRVKAVVNRLDNWNAATKALKNLKNEPPLSNPSKIYTYYLDHEIQVEETKDTVRVLSDLDCTRGLFERIYGHSLEDIMSKGKMTYEELFKMEYSQAQKLRLAAYYLRRDFSITKNDKSALSIQSSSQPPQVQDNRLQTPGLVQPETVKTHFVLNPEVRSADIIVTKILTGSIVEDLDSTTVKPFLQSFDQTKRNEIADTKRPTATDEATIDKRTADTDESTVEERTTATDESTDSERTTTDTEKIDTRIPTVLLFGLEVDDTSRRSLLRKKIRKLPKRTRKISDSQAESRKMSVEDLVSPPCYFDWQEDKWKKKSPSDTKR